LLSVVITGFCASAPILSARARGGLPLAHEADALVEVNRRFLRRRFSSEGALQRLACDQAAQQFGRESPLRRLGRDDDGGESHGGLLSCLKCQEPPPPAM
jgi:hypothetical protein